MGTGASHRASCGSQQLAAPNRLIEGLAVAGLVYVLHQLLLGALFHPAADEANRWAAREPYGIADLGEQLR